MHSFEQQDIALRCVGLADGNLDQAKRIYAFVTGEDGKPDVQTTPLVEIREAIRDLAIRHGLVGTDPEAPQPQ